MEGFAEQLSSHLSKERVDPFPDCLQYLRSSTQLYAHQEDAVRFIANADNGCLLADEMGLGKSLSSIAYMSYLKAHDKGAKFLLVCPLSVSENFCREIRSFSTLTCVLLSGTAAERQEVRDEFAEGNTDVLVTTYEFASKESWLAKVQFACLIVDEAHRLKNCESLLYKSLTAVKADFILLLTGTPVHNSLDELFNLLSFCNSEAFVGKRSLFEDFNHREASDTDKEALHRVLRILMLRRLKEEIDLGIPAKLELTLFCALTKMQHDLYVAALARDYKALNTNASAGSISSVLMNLRKVSCHPYLMGVEPTNKDGEFELGEHLVNSCGKLLMLDALLRRFRKEGRKVLIFSTMTRLLDILQDFLFMREYPCERLDGSVRALDRNVAIDTFSRADDSFCFLLSTRAGGVGINLTAATAVVFYDVDWNPQMDMQAEARAHRIGQTKEVIVVRLISRNTVDEIILKRAREKRGLATVVADEGRGGDAGDMAKLSSTELMDMLQYGLAELESSDARPTDSDLDAMFEDAMEQRQKKENRASGESSLKRTKTIVRHSLDDQEELGSMYEYEGTDYTDAGANANANAEALQKIVDTASKAAPAQSGSSSPPRVSLAERGARSKAKRKIDLEDLWLQNGYASRKIGPSEIDLSELEENDLQHVIGDCAVMSSAKEGDIGVVVVCVNRSGEFGSGRFFESIVTAHGDTIEDEYAAAKENRDLEYGNVHLIGKL